MKKLILLGLSLLSVQQAYCAFILSDATLAGTGTANVTDTVFSDIGNDSQLSFLANGGTNHTLGSDVDMDLGVAFGFGGTSTGSGPDVTLNGVKGFSIEGLGGLTSFTITATYGDLIRGRSRTPSSLTAFPWGFATGLIDAGTGGSVGGFDVAYTVSNIVKLTDITDPNSATTALGSPAPVASAQYDTGIFTGNELTLTSSNGFSGVVPNLNQVSGNYLILRALDSDTTAGGLTAAEIEEFYADTFEVTITADSGTFADDANFLFSFDGDRSLDVVAPVPEPSSVFLLSFSALGLAFRRKR